MVSIAFCKTGNSMVMAMETAEPYHKPFISSKNYAIFSNVMLYLSIYQIVRPIFDIFVVSKSMLRSTAIYDTPEGTFTKMD